MKRLILIDKTGESTAFDDFNEAMQFPTITATAVCGIVLNGEKADYVSLAVLAQWEREYNAEIA